MNEILVEKSVLTALHYFDTSSKVAGGFGEDSHMLMGEMMEVSPSRVWLFCAASCCGVVSEMSRGLLRGECQPGFDAQSSSCCGVVSERSRGCCGEDANPALMCKV